jgi:hypothetical protein
MTPRLGAYPPDVAIPVHNLAILLTEVGRRQVALARSAARRRPIPVLGRGIPETGGAAAEQTSGVQPTQRTSPSTTVRLGAHPSPGSHGHRSPVVGMDMSDDQVGSPPTRHGLGRVPGMSLPLRAEATTQASSATDSPFYRGGAGRPRPGLSRAPAASVVEWTQRVGTLICRRRDYRCAVRAWRH